MPKKNTTDLERLMAFVKKTKDGHWLWTGARGGGNREYGSCKYLGKTAIAHRVMWTLIRGKIPVGLDILHQCGQTLCVNPAHVRVGTHKENHAEAVAARGGVNWASGPKGEKHGNSVFSDRVSESIKREYAGGKTQAYLAAKHNVTQPCISMIVNGKRRAM